MSGGIGNIVLLLRLPIHLVLQSIGHNFHKTFQGGFHPFLLPLPLKVFVCLFLLLKYFFFPKSPNCLARQDKDCDKVWTKPTGELDWTEINKRKYPGLAYTGWRVRAKAGPALRLPAGGTGNHAPSYKDVPYILFKITRLTRGGRWGRAVHKTGNWHYS